jgi:hypothetical protein
MKVLMIGDVVAKPGRIAVLERIQDLREQHQIDFAIMNAENLAGGFSVTPAITSLTRKKQSSTSANSRASFVPRTTRRTLRAAVTGRAR